MGDYLLDHRRPEGNGTVAHLVIVLLAILAILLLITCLAPHAKAAGIPPNPNAVPCAGFGPCGYTHVAANASTQVKTGAGFLHAITINTKGATDTITVYDNSACSGTTIAVIDDAALAGTVIFDAGFTVGLCVKTAGTTAPDITISAR